MAPLYEELPDGPAVASPIAPNPVHIGSVAIKAARAQLNPVRAPESVMPLVGAAALCAAAALALVTVVILGPPNLGPDVTIDKPVPVLRDQVR